MRKIGSVSLSVSFAAAAVAVGAGALLARAPVRAQATAGASESGKQIYERICQGCHMPDAKGAIGAGKYPALAGDPALASKQFMALTLINGRRNMPAFSSKHAFGFGGTPAALTSAQMAAVINYVRGNFGNHFSDAITPEEVTALERDSQ